ncbi:MAG: hypothetical protein VR71_21935 [Roseovarius sp. BRH_c41]|uniref:hypothetical protein n=1 Tax=Roseovarius sp. BRH_c41 TaxID=1629709 RepID=UPI0005F1A052|nr:hypothetical protein [Roseovarius sp. BRH_c41]KJS40656.1 MAG: hypothetical protein VR71_21935 [Roseovarius sp. BRH_c41]
MNKISMFVAAAAIACSAAAPVFADDAKVNADPFVSTQSESTTPGLGVTAATATAIVVGAIIIGAVAGGSDDSSSTTTTTN